MVCAKLGNCTEPVQSRGSHFPGTLLHSYSHVSALVVFHDTVLAPPLPTTLGAKLTLEVGSDCTVTEVEQSLVPQSFVARS